MKTLKNILLIAGFVVTLLTLIYTRLQYKKTSVITVDTPTDQQQRPISNENQDKATFDEVIETRSKEKEKKVEDLKMNPVANYSNFINASTANSTEEEELTIIVLDENKENLYSEASSIIELYNQIGLAGKSNLIKSSFLKHSGFKELAEGNSHIIEKLELAKYVDYIAIGNLSYEFIEGTLVNGSVICHATLTMNIISTKAKSIVKSFTIPQIAGNGVNETQAKQYAFQALLRKYSKTYLTL